jgi:hypothetical protein
LRFLDKKYIPFWNYLQGKKLLEEEDAEDLLISSGMYPKYIEPPVDQEYNEETRRIEAFFNINKFLKFHNLEWIKEKYPSLVLKIDEATANNETLANYADGLVEKLTDYNESSATEQFEEDLRVTFRRSVYGTLAILAVLGLIIFGIIPFFLTSSGQRDFDNGNYQSAYNYFSTTKGLSDKSHSGKMAKLSKMNLLIQEEKYDEALKMAKDMEGITIDGHNTDNLRQYVFFQKGKYLSQKKKWEEAAYAFIEAGEYENAQQELINAAYKAHPTLVKNKKYGAIVKIFVYLVGYQDAEELMLKAMEQHYLVGLREYKNKNYSKALEVFKLLKKYKYKTSEAMEKEVLYQQSKELIEQQKPDEAIKKLSEIADFKDSSALLKELNYQKATQYIATDPYQALQYLLLSYNYKESNKLMLNGNIVIYGSWDITEMDNATITQYKMTFTGGNTVALGKDIPEDISNEFSSETYTYDNGKFIANNKTLEVVEAITLNKIKIKTNGHTFTLERNKSLSGLAKNNSNLDLSILLPEYFDTASKKDELSNDTEESTKESSSSTSESSSSKKEKEDSSKEKKENKKDNDNKKESKKEDYEL